MPGTLTSFRQQSLRGLTTAFILNGMLASAAPPGWWMSGDSPVINPAATAENKGVANIGQAKWVAKRALDSLRLVLPDTAELIEADLVGYGKPIANWGRPSTPEEKEKQRAPLLLGQLKAISAPFYEHLNAVAPQWVASERAFYNLPTAPWTAATTDDSNKSVALIGQLKAIFSLDFAADREVGTAADDLPDLWEWSVVNSSPVDTWTGIGQIDAGNADQAGTDTGTPPPVKGTSSDYDGDGEINEFDADPWDPVVDWSPVPTTSYVTTVLGQFNYEGLDLEPKPGSMWSFPETRHVTGSIGDFGLVLWNDMTPPMGSYPRSHRSRAWKNGSWSGDLRSGALVDSFQFQTKYVSDDGVYPAATREIIMTAEPKLNLTDPLSGGGRFLQPQAVSGDYIVGVGDYEGLAEDQPQISTIVVNGVPERVVTNDFDVTRSFHPVAVRWQYDLIAEEWRASPVAAPARTSAEYGDPWLNSQYDLSYWPRSLASPAGGSALIGGTHTKEARRWFISGVYGDNPSWTKKADSMSGRFSPEVMDNYGRIFGRSYEGPEARLVVEEGGAQELSDSKSNDEIYAMAQIYSMDSHLLIAGSKLWVRKGGAWKKARHTPTNLPIMAIASDGVLLGPKAIWKNGYDISLDKLVQKPESAVTPRFSNLRGYAMNSDGAILALADDNENVGAGKKTLLVLSPVVIKGVNPDDLELTSEYTGVDNTSCSDPIAPQAEGYEPTPWIMVPNGGSTWVRFDTQAASDNVWNMDPISNLTFTPQSLDTGSVTVKIQSDGVATAQPKLNFEVGGQVGVIPPIRIKSMKRREVKVTLMPITATYNQAKKAAPNDPPNYVPTAEELENYLNKIFGRQVNAWFTVTVTPATVEWDRLEEADLLAGGSRTPGDAVITYGNRTLDYSYTLDERGNLPPKDPNSHITVYVMGGCDDLRFHGVANGVYTGDGGTIGVAKRDTDQVFVRGEYDYGETNIGRIMESLMNTIAHEIGHITISYGHPDTYANTGNSDYRANGEAPLYPNWLDEQARLRFYQKRLMCSGGIVDDRTIRKQLVKREWDFFDNWMMRGGQ